MGDIMRQIQFKELIIRILNEYKASGSIFGIDKINFFRKKNGKTYNIFGENCDTAIGPAAGPHTQLAQNIICSYLTGGRFIELKTVQIMDNLEIGKPCIDAEDEGYNTEWSTELTLEKAYDEYIKAWIILHFIEILFGFRKDGRHSFTFNMSAGYDLKGITAPKMDCFINDMINSSGNPVFNNYLKDLEAIINTPDIFQSSGQISELNNVKGISGTISPNICKSLTLSTMHGCPPREIEDICSYMIKEKKINTFVKLNPTLLGFNRVRTILDDLGFSYIELKEETFKKDLQYSDAVSMLKRLLILANENSVNFGIKLSNTLGVVNNKQVLPGTEMYMSGRALFPLTINLAASLAEEFNGNIHISYSGGASAFNIRRIIETGIRPITMATELLKPGGYNRMKEAAMELEEALHPDDSFINVNLLKQLAFETLTANNLQKSWRGKNKAAIDRELPMFDCYAAPCVHACPISQDVPEYIKLTGEKKYKEALKLIYSRNALPSITGYICDHQCMYSCTRLDYEGAVLIREMKKIAVESGWKEFKAGWIKPGTTKNIKTAVIGSGPAGLSAAYFLAKEGISVTVFEKEKSAGGVIKNILPGFRIPEAAVQRDIEFIKAHGVNFKFGSDIQINIEKLKSNGFKYICIGIGAEKGKHLTLKNSTKSNIIESLEFLKRFKNNPSQLKPGTNVAVIGGGNTAMDSARAAKRLAGVKTVSVLYRRTENEMPADREEYEAALKDGIKFHFLRSPEEFHNNLICRIMKLGEPDSSGRLSPVPTEDTEVFNIDTLITAIGEHADTDTLKNLGVSFNEKGEVKTENVFLIGDVRTGPSSVVRCIADARKAVNDILDKENIKNLNRTETGPDIDIESVIKRKGRLNTGIEPGNKTCFASDEASRCLECSYICNKCEDVCPNRANIAVACNGNFKDAFQIVHIDALCNECGNCGTFCPYNGAPYKDKFTVFNLKEDFINSSNSGFLQEARKIRLRMDGIVSEFKLTEDNRFNNINSYSTKIKNALSLIETLIKNYNYLLYL